VLTTNKTPFYVDFVIKFKDGRIGLFDPHGTQFSDFGSKSDGLQKYIKKNQFQSYPIPSPQKNFDKIHL